MRGGDEVAPHSPSKGELRGALSVLNGFLNDTSLKSDKVRKGWVVTAKERHTLQNTVRLLEEFI